MNPDSILAKLALLGLDTSFIKEKAPDFLLVTDATSEGYDQGRKIGEVLAMAQAMATRRHLDNLITMGFTREEAVAIMAGGGMTKIEY